MADQSHEQATDKSSLTSTTIFSRILTTTDPYEKLINLPIPVTPLDQNTKDISLNPDLKTSIRIFRPPSELSVTTKLPTVIYFHGGGFILFSADSTVIHNFCQSIATHLPAIVLSVDYRLAPESRLPAAYDDAGDALKWVKDQAADTLNGEPWLKEYADFSRCFIMGCSAGGNIAYHANLRAVEMDLEPLKINGLILHQPLFGSLERTESKLRLINDLYIDGSESSGANVGFYGDPVIDHQIKLVKMLEEKGVKVETCIAEGGFHGVAFYDPKTLVSLLGELKHFI
ncbi:hypothetical protein MKW92_046206 [Papaver armeniacum]|nr:hypothetical protein MKW92_046206 [Papaver armeniacum]